MSDLMTASGDTELTLKPFRLVSALGDHDVIVDVRFGASRTGVH